MNIFPSVQTILSKYGSEATVINGEAEQKIKVFISPIRSYYSRPSDRIRHLTGTRKTNLFRLIAPPDAEIESGKSVIEAAGNKYTVKRCETYFVKGSAVYVRALLNPYAETEDDYGTD